MTTSIGRKTLHTTAALGLRLAVQASNLLVVTRILGPEGFGAFAGIAALAVTLGTLSSFGTHLVLLREMSLKPERGDEVLPFALGTTAFFGGLLLLTLIGVVFTLLPHPLAMLPVALFIGVAEIWIQPLLVLASVDRQARGEIAQSQLLLVLPSAFRLTAATLILALNPAHRLSAYALAYFIASILSLLAVARSCSLRIPTPRRWRIPRKDEWRDLGGYAALNLTAMGPTELDKTLASRLLPLAYAGLYAAGARVVGAVVLPVMAMMLASLPRLFRDGASPHGARFLRRIFVSAATYGVLAASLLYFGAGEIERLFGARFAGLGSLLSVLALAVPAMALRLAAGNALMAINHPWWRAGTELVGLTTLLVAACTLTLTHPRTGMPLALICSESAMALAGWLLLLSRRPA